MNISFSRVVGLFVAGIGSAAVVSLVAIPTVGGPGVWVDNAAPAAVAVSDAAQVDVLRAAHGDVGVVCVGDAVSTCVPGVMAFGRLWLTENSSDDPVVRELLDRPVRELKARGWTADPTDGCECLYPPESQSV